MALRKEQIATGYPLPSYNYKVTIGSEILPFSEVSGLNIEFEKVVYKHGLSFLSGYDIVRAQQNEISITLKRGVVAKRDHFYNWLTNKSSKDLIIDLCNEKGAAIVRWKVRKAIPVKLEAPSFIANGNDVAIESIELTAQDLLIEFL